MKLYQLIALGVAGVWSYGKWKQSQHTALVVGGSTTNPQSQSLSPLAKKVVAPKQPAIKVVDHPGPAQRERCNGPAPLGYLSGIVNETNFASAGDAVIAGEPETAAINPSNASLSTMVADSMVNATVSAVGIDTPNTCCGVEIAPYYKWNKWQERA